MKGQATTARAWGKPDIAQALMDAVDSIADMAQRVQLNGPEVTYASEKLAHAVYKAAEGLALCGVDIGEVIGDARDGQRLGVYVREGET